MASFTFTIKFKKNIAQKEEYRLTVVYSFKKLAAFLTDLNFYEVQMMQDK